MKGIREFIIKSVEEFKKVEWPSNKETVRLTGYVIGVSLIIALFVMGLDYIFTEALTFLIR